MTQFQVSLSIISCPCKVGWNILCWMCVAEEVFHLMVDREKEERERGGGRRGRFGARYNFQSRFPVIHFLQLGPL